MTLTRVYAVSEQAEASDPEYTHGLKAAVSAALDYGLNAIEHGKQPPPPIPAVLLAQARLAARSGVSLDTVLRRYLAGYTLLGDFVIQESGKGNAFQGKPLERLLRSQAALLDHVLAAVGEEYSREKCERPEGSKQRRADRVKRLLAGELLDTSELAYELGGWHLGLMATGSVAAEALTDFAGALDRRLLLIEREEGSVWAWLGSRRGFDARDLELFLAHEWPPGISLAHGEPAKGPPGWRLTHRQAKAALSVALARPEAGGVVRYADVALLASVLRDDLLVTSLSELYLAPLAAERDQGKVARETLCAYFAAGGNVSSAAVALGVKRHTVTHRLRTIEQLIDRPLSTYAADMDIALKLQEMGISATPYTEAA